MGILLDVKLTVWMKAGVAAAGTLWLNDRAWRKEKKKVKWNKLIKKQCLTAKKERLSCV